MKKLLILGLGYTGYKMFQPYFSRARQEQVIDQTSEESFPASDAPSSNQFTGL